MAAAIGQRFARRTGRIQAKPEILRYCRDLSVAVKTVIAEPIAHHCRVAVSETFVDLFVMPGGKFSGDCTIYIKFAQQAQCPTASLVLDIGRQVRLKKMCASHLSKLVKRPKQARFTS